MKNRSIWILILTLFVGIHIAFPGETEEKSVERKNSLEKGAWAMQFLIDENFKLTSFQGSTLSLKNHLADDQALRIGLTMSGTLSSMQSDQNIFQSDTTYSDKTTDSNQLGFTLKLHYIMYPTKNKYVNLYWGIGPEFGRNYQYLRGEMEQDLQSDISDRDIMKRETTQYSLGITGFMGVEWFANPAISFSAEYGIALHHVWNQVKQTDVSEKPTRRDGQTESIRESEAREKSWYLQYVPVRFGLSVYF